MDLFPQLLKRHQKQVEETQKQIHPLNGLTLEKQMVNTLHSLSPYFTNLSGEIVKGTILPPLHRENDVIISRDVPIINVLLDDALKEETNPKEKNKTPTMKEKEPKSPTKPDSKYQKDNPSSETFNACDAGTQTEKFEKKGGCHIM
jgi:hypothetical protein